MPSRSFLPDSAPSSQDLLRRRMLRLTLMVGVILTGVTVLGVAALFMSMDAQRQKERAEAAERETQEQLWRAYRNEASAVRLHGQQGRRIHGLAAIRKAAAGWHALHGGETGDSPERRDLRNEATALLALSDMPVAGTPWPLPPGDPLVAVNAGAGLVAAGQESGQIEIRRLDDGTLVASLDTTADFSQRLFLTGLAWRPGAPTPQLGLWFKSGEAGLWSLEERKLIFASHPGYGLMGGGPPPGGFSMDGRLMAWCTGANSPISIVDLENGNASLRHALKPGRRVFALRPGNKEIAISDQGRVRVRNLATGEEVNGWKLEELVNALAWSADGQRLAAMTAGGNIRIWRLDTLATWSLSGHTGLCRALAFSPDGTTLMSSSQDSMTRWWDTDRGTLLLASGTGKGLGYSDDGSSVYYAGKDGTFGRWDVSPSPLLQRLTLTTPTGAIDPPSDLSADGRWFATLFPTGMVIWDTAHLDQPWPQFLPGLTSFQFLAPDTLLTFVSGRAFTRRLTFDGGALQLQPAVPLDLGMPAGQQPRMVSPSADGHSLLVESQSLRFGTVDLTGGRPFQLLDGQQDLTYYLGAASQTGGGRLAISPDGSLSAISYGIGKGSAVFDSRSGRRLWITDRAAGVAAFSQDGASLLLSQHGGIGRYDSRTGAETGRISAPGQVTASGSLACTTTGLVAVADSPLTLQLYRSGDLSPVVSLLAPQQRDLRGCRLARDGSVLVETCTSSEFLFWDLGRLRGELQALGLDWQDSPVAIPPGIPASPVAGRGLWKLAAGLCTAAVIAALAAVILLRRHHGLMRDFAGAETLLLQQKRDLEQANFSLLHSQKMKALGTLAAGMAHDFNNMLSVIRMSNRLIARETRGNADVTELVESVEAAVLQGKEVVRSMLSYSRRDDGRSDARSPAEIVRDTAGLLSKEFLHGIVLTLHLDESAPAVRVPPGLIEQILINLIVNASEAMQGTGNLTISLDRAGPAEAAQCVLPPHAATAWTRICVADTGPGVPPEIADRIFEPFFTTKNAGNERGNGLGLSMVYTIAERDGMGLGLQSRPGEGAVFQVLLPADPVPESPTATLPYPA